MYFQNLENLKSSIPKMYIELLDFWLGSMSQIYYKKINPKEFAIKSGMDIESVFKLFDLAVEKNVLVPKIIVVDDNNVPFGTFHDVNKVPKVIEDIENNILFNVEKHNMEIWYELIDSPKGKSALEENTDNKVSTEYEEKSTFDNLEKSGAAFTLRTLKAKSKGLKNWKKQD